MTFNTEKNKIFKIWNDSNENQFQINILSDNDKIILNKIQRLNDTDTVYNNIINLSSEWLNPNIQVDNDDIPFQIYQEYSIEINGINKNLIPYIESKIVYRLGDSEISIPIPDAPDEPGSPFDEEATFQLNDITEIKTVTEVFQRNIVYRSSIFLEDGAGLPEGLQFKFFIDIFNPNYYQST